MIRVTVAGGMWTAADKLFNILSGQGVRVRALIEDPLMKGISRKKGSLEFIGVNLEDPLSLRVAFQDTDRAFLVCGNSARPPRYDLALIDAAVRAGVPYLVNLSEGGGYPGQSAREWQSETDIHLARQSIQTTRIHPSLSFDAVFTVASRFIPMALWGGSAGSGQAALVDSRDVAAAAARILLEGAERHADKRYTLTGPAAVTMGYLADYLSETLARKVRYFRRTRDEQRGVYLNAGLCSTGIDRLLGQDALICNGFYAEITADIVKLTHRPATTAVDWIEEHAEKFVALVGGQ
ncbi:NmrA family NAD(P)-binding protein [Acerihabitans sp. KWT182]|uniref:NmrA family NAD(P)-binding protein n=1 Tax=Acerihabitans sp. KWT182 TaxID=3157919 RepID=A0AAU7QAJ8_9GAMM